MFRAGYYVIGYHVGIHIDQYRMTTPIPLCPMFNANPYRPPESDVGDGAAPAKPWTGWTAVAAFALTVVNSFAIALIGNLSRSRVLSSERQLLLALLALTIVFPIGCLWVLLILVDSNRWNRVGLGLFLSLAVFNTTLDLLLMGMADAMHFDI